MPENRKLPSWTGEGSGVGDNANAKHERPHTWRWAWHFETDRLEVNGGRAVAAFTDGPAMRVQSVAARPQELQTCAGKTEPRVCGWRSEGASNKPVSAPALVATSAAGSGPM